MKKLREYVDWTMKLFKKDKPVEQPIQVVTEIKPEVKKRGRKQKIQS